MGQKCCCENTSSSLGGIVKSSKTQPQDQWMEEVLSKPAILTLQVQSPSKVDTIEVTSTSTTRDLRELLQVKGFIRNINAQVVVDGNDLPDNDFTLAEAGFEDGMSLICREDPRMLSTSMAQQDPSSVFTSGPVPPPVPDESQEKQAVGKKEVSDSAVNLDPGHFVVEVSRASEPDASKLGLVIYCREGESFLRIRAIRPGLITEWNTRNASSNIAVTKDTLILSVNDIKEPKACAEELSRATS
eukprot:CAMPEP_0178414088 /NCGR_PEP_ID=MMETSP0689_2-20121128/22857_1 /TAXON_ID=160604 /ORGANISM="Amphidinium massartii, Strain CS-259" /LENGTH=243 /DNA_ID=CAMNT_0020035369 /DNA_START=128 /DNA_END=856 /DNA_ORIENTATION=+